MTVVGVGHQAADVRGQCGSPPPVAAGLHGCAVSVGGAFHLHDIYSAELLHKHDEIRKRRGPTVSSHSKEILPVAAAASLGLDLEQLVGVVHVPSRLNGVMTQSANRTEGLLVLSLFHVPSRAFGAEVNLRIRQKGRFFFLRGLSILSPGAVPRGVI